MPKENEVRNNRCENCQFWRRNDNEAYREAGACRVRHPVIIERGDYDDSPYGIWPKTFDNDWCGEFKQRQTI